MSRAVVIACVVVNIASVIASNLSFAWAAQYSGWRQAGWFALGLSVGILAPVTITVALRHAHPNLFFAICGALSFLGLQIAACRVLHTSLSMGQWLGVLFIVSGVVLMQWHHPFAAE